MRQATVILVLGLVVVMASAVFAQMAQVGAGDSVGMCTQQRDQDRDGTQQQDRDRERICDCGNFIDADGDGYCDNCDTCPNPDAQDHDGDGTHNGQDDDYTPPGDGTGQQKRAGK